MERIEISPRTNWENKVESIGFEYHANYWNEKAFYRFTSKEIDSFEKATNDLDEMCQNAVQYVIDNDKFDMFGITNKFAELIAKSWECEDQNLYGRFDFAYDGKNFKMYEYNADTPTSLFEASVVQWQWLQDVFPKSDQFNSIHERLIAAWDMISKKEKFNNIHFAYYEDNSEDTTTALYIADTAAQAGLGICALDIRDVGSDGTQFYDLNDNKINMLFKLYPWEMMVRDKFASCIETSRTKYIEPIWKMLLSNKALLTILWEMYPKHPNLLQSSFSPENISGKMVRKPILSREGANVSFGTYSNKEFTLSSDEHHTDGAYGAPYIYQEQFKSSSFTTSENGKVIPVIGSWVIASESAGMGIREDSGVTSNMARFVPHIFD